MPRERHVGRPLKFGRPTQALMLSLPDDVVKWLKSIHPDPGWAIVALFDGYTTGLVKTPAQPAADASLSWLPKQQALIVVAPDVFRHVPNVSLVPLADGRALLAFEPGRGLADLELAVRDALESLAPADKDYDRLHRLRRQLTAWRQDASVRFETRSIIVAIDRRKGRQGRALPSILEFTTPKKRRTSVPGRGKKAGGLT